MKALKRVFSKKLKDQKGQSTTEYILILLVVVMVAKQFSGGFSKIMKGATDSLQRDISSVVDSTQQ